MADNLIFPIGFNLETAVKNAEREGESAIKRLENVFSRQPLAIRLDTKGFAELGQNIETLKARLKEIRDQWETMPTASKFDLDSDGKIKQLTTDGKALWDELLRINTALQGVGQGIQQFAAQSSRALQEEIRFAEQMREAEIRRYNETSRAKLKEQEDDERRYQRWLANKEKEVQKEQETAQRKQNAQERAANASRKALREAEIEAYRVNAALRAQENVLGNLTAKLNIYQQRIQGQQIGTDAWNKTALEIRRLAEELQKATQQMQDFQQKSFQGLSDSLTKGKVQALTQLREQLRQIEADYNRLNQTGAAYNSNGGLTTAANDILRQREAIIKQINQMLSTAADAQIEREKEINRVIEQRKAKADAIAAKRKSEQAAIQANISKLKEERRILNQQESSVASITAKLQIQQQRLQSAKFGSDAFNKATKEVERLSKKLDEAKQKIDNLTGRTQSAASAQSAAVRQVSQEFQAQDGYVSRLLKRMAVYAGYSMATNFITSIRDVTAEFELQRVSLGAIIQDQQRANQLFAEIKSFALTSPLKILDLTKYTKQVAAYGFETEKLFDTTKMLADISVGLGVDMSRLSLFLGQVFATGHLRASEVRQATEAGIPLVDKLAQKLTEANGKLVTAADVMDLISKRAISFEQVEEVFKDMTSVGGEFYNMQVKQSQTLFGMWSKLGDAAAIMYDQIGNTSTVNAGMKTTMGLLESMMRNWKTTARVLDTVSVALAVYVIGLKNAAVASTAMTTTEAARLAITNRQIIATPKLIAAIIGQNTATKLSTTLTKAHTVAMLNQSTATNVLSRGFWKLTAAMLANPWVAAAAGIALVVTALIHFIGNTETAAERAEKLNNSVASLKNLEDTTKPLIDTYNELINKTERTAEEQKKLSEVTHELAKQYPGAITAIGNFGEEVELAADELNQLYQAEKQARMDNTRHELQETEKQIASTEARIAQLQKYLSEGKMWSGGGGTGGGGGAMVAMSDEERGRILKQIDMLRYGEDGQSGLFGLQQSAEAARRALGLIPSEAAQAVEKFGAWKKTLTTFRQEVGNIRVQLFDDSTIAQFGSLEEALKKTAEEYKKNIALVATYDETLKSTSLTSEERAKIETERAEADAMANLAEKALKYYNAMSLLNTSTSGRGTRTSDPRLQNLKEEISLTKKLYDEYHKLEKQIGATKAAEKIQQIYENTISTLEGRAEKYGFEFELPFTDENLKANMQHFIDKMKELQGLKDKKGKPLFPNIGKEIDEAVAQLEDVDLNSLQRALEKKLKDLADRISRTKTAKEFYEKILSTTGDYSLASKVAESIFGQNGSELRKALAEQVRSMAGDIPLPDNIISADNIINYKALRQFAEANKNELGKMYEELIKISNDGQKDLAKTYEGYLKDLEKAKSYSDKRIELARYTANQIAEINASTLPEDEKQRLTTGYRELEDKEAAKLQYEAFKNSALYVQMFEDLDHASTSALTRMRDRLIELKSQWKNLSPTELKELQLRLNELGAQIAARNPFKALGDAYKKWRDLIKSGRTKEGDELKADAAGKARQEAEKKMLADEKAYEAVAASLGANSVLAKIYRSIADKSKEAYDNAEKTANETAEMVTDWGDITELIDNANQKIDEYQQQINEALDGVRKMMVALGAGDEDLQFFDDVVSSLNEIVDAGQDAATAVGAAMTGDYFTAATKGISAIGGLISGFSNLFHAGKVKRANKEIKRLQELLDQLEYTYGRLEKAADKAFGADYLNNYNQQIKVLQAQQAAYLKQAEAERSKGKKEDKEKTKEYLENARDVADQIKELQDDLVAQIVGTDVASTARDFANAWLDAYLSFGSTTDAIKEKFDDMIKNMIVNMVLAQVVKRALEPIFKMIDDLAADGELSADDIAKVMSKVPSTMTQINDGLSVGVKALEAAGVDISKLRDGSSEFSGIAKDIAGATSEEINQLSAFVNTALYYVSPIPTISENVALIRQLMERGTTSTLPDTTAAGWTDWQQQAMDNYIAIAANTAATVVECRRAANACEASVEKLRTIITSKGSVSGVNVFMKG